MVLSLPKSVHIEGNIEPAGVDMRSQNPRFCRHFMGIRLPGLAIRVGEVPSSNLGAPIKKPPEIGGFFLREAPLVTVSIWAVSGSNHVCGVPCPEPKAACLHGFRAL
jgi:hypothetical protein